MTFPHYITRSLSSNGDMLISREQLRKDCKSFHQIQTVASTDFLAASATAMFLSMCLIGNIKDMWFYFQNSCQHYLIFLPLYCKIILHNHWRGWWHLSLLKGRLDKPMCIVSRDTRKPKMSLVISIAMCNICLKWLMHNPKWFVSKPFWD